MTALPAAVAVAASDALINSLRFTVVASGMFPFVRPVDGAVCRSPECGGVAGLRRSHNRVYSRSER